MTPIAGAAVAPDAQSAARPAPAEPHAELRQVAEELEAAFLAEMLKHAGFGASRESLGGGAGEDQFASLLRTEHARAIAERGGIGLAESVFRSLVERAGAVSGSGDG